MTGTSSGRATSSSTRFFTRCVWSARHHRRRLERRRARRRCARAAASTKCAAACSAASRRAALPRRRLLLAPRQHAAADAPVPDAGRSNPTGTVVAVEFFNRALHHYFMSTNPARSTTSTPACTSAGSAPACASSPTTSPGAGHEPGVPLLSRAGVRRLALLFGEPDGMRSDRGRASGRLDLREPERVLHPAAEHDDRRVPGGNACRVPLLQPVTTNHRYTADVIMRDEMRDSSDVDAGGLRAGPV